jgi:hypothetical protein
MALENVANEDLLVEFTNTVGPPDIVYTGDIGIDPVKVVPTKSTKCKAMSKLICTTGITLTFAVGGNECPHTSATYTFVAGVGTVTTTATKTRADAQIVLREGDTGT